MLKNKFLLAIIAVMCSTAVLKAQNIEIDNAQLALPTGYYYGSGSSVGVPIKLNGCFSKTNLFKWQILSKTGTPVGVSGSIAVFYATFINVTMPVVSLATGIDSFKIAVTDSGTVGALGDTSDFIYVKHTTSLINANAVPVDPNLILRDQYYYGICDGNPSSNANAKFILKDSSVGGNLDSLTLIDNYRVNYPVKKFTPTASGNFDVLFSPNSLFTGTLTRDAYYTAYAKTINTVDNVVSTKGYHIINSTWGITTYLVTNTTTGTKKSCEGDTATLYIDVDTTQRGHLQQNFPSALIRIDWKDGSKQDYTICEILAANGYVKHYYSKGACLPPNQNINYSVTTTVTNPFNVFNGPGITGTCGSGAASGVSIYVFSAPKANFKVDSVVCAGDTLKFVNLSSPGQGIAQTGGSGAGEFCAQLAHYTWLVDTSSLNVPSYKTIYETPGTKVEGKKDTAYSWSFSLPGRHNVKLMVNNNYGNDAPCPSHDTTRMICVDTAKVRPNFILADSSSGVLVLKDSIISCAPQFKIRNTTRRTLCVDSTQFKYKWRVLDATTMAVVTDNSYYHFIKSNDSSMSPEISIDKTGKFFIELNANAKCDLDTSLRMLKYVEANGDAGVQFSVGGIGTNADTVRSCIYPTPLVINYGSATPNGQLTPSSVDSIRYTYQASAAPSLKYKWTISRVGTPATTPADYDFISGTTADSAYPVIRFKTPGLYAVTDSFSNNCRDKVATQYVAYRQEVSIAGPSGPIDTICYNGTYNVSGFSIDTVNWGKVGRIEWTSSCGSFNPASGLPSDPNMLTPVFTPTANYTGTCSFTMAAYAPSPSSCTLKSVNRDIYFRPDVILPDTNFNTCSGSQVGYQVTIPGLIGTLLTWTATATPGVFNFNSNNTTPLPLINDAPTGNGIITYTVYPKVGTCVGAPFTVTDTVREIPTAPVVNLIKPNNATSSMCSGDTAMFMVLNNNPGDLINWTSFSNQGLIGGLTALNNQNLSQTAISNLDNILTNTNAALTTDTATYCFTITSQYGCKGLAQTCNSVVVTPGPNIASITGLPDKYLCADTCYIIKHNIPGAAGKGLFTIVSSSNIVDTLTLTDTTFQVCGLKPGGSYKFKWTIDPQLTGCVSSSDSLTLNVTDTLPTPFLMADTAICDADGFTQHNVPLRVDLSRALGRFEYLYWNNGLPTVATFPYTATQFQYNLKVTNYGTYTVPVRVYNGACADKYDTVLVRVFSKPYGGSVQINPSQNSYCQGSTITLSSNFDTTYGTMGNWYFHGYSMPTNTNNYFNFGSNPTSLVATESGYAVATVYSKGWNYGCYDSTPGGNKTILIDSATVAGTIKVNGDTIICSPTTVSFSIVGNKGDAINIGSNSGNGWIISTGGAAGPYGPPAFVGKSAQILISTTSWIRAIVQNGNCGHDTTPPQRIFLPSNADAAKTGNDTAVCGLDTFRLVGNVPLAGTGDWTLLSGALNDASIYPGTLPGVHTFNNAGITTTTNPVVANIKNYGVYQFVWVIRNLSCPGTADTITVVNTQPLVNNTISPAVDTVCKGINLGFTGSVPSGGSGGNKYTWERSIDGGTTWSTVGLNANSYTFPGDTTSLIRRRVQSDSCISYSLATQVVVQVPIANNVIATPVPTGVCINSPAMTLNGATPTGGSGSYNYVWETATNFNLNAGLWNNLNTNNEDYTPVIGLNLTDTANYRRIVVSGKCSDTSAYVKVDVYPNAKAVMTFLPSDTSGCAPFTVQIQPAPLSLITNYTWYADSAGVRTNIGTGAGFPGYKMNSGLDAVKITLVASSTLGCNSDSTNQTFHTSATPFAAFTISADSGCANNTGLNTTTFTFTNTTPNTNLFSYVLNYGDGNSPSWNPPTTAYTHTFGPSSTGLDTNYCITVTALSPSCGSSQKTQCIKVRTRPHVNFSLAPSYQCSGGIVNFYDQSTTSPNATNLWVFGDGTPNATAKDSTQHIYLDSALTSHPAKLIVSNECASDSFVNNVVIAANTVKLNISVNPLDRYKCLPASDTFFSNSTGATDYQWNFGDGNYSPIINNGTHSVVHLYTTPGVYTVTLTGSTTCGTVSKTDIVYVYGTPKVAFSISPNTTACIGDTVRLNNLTDTFTSHGWTYGNGNGSIDYRVYNGIGVYPVQLWATRTYSTPLGGVKTCTDTSSTQTVTIRDTMLATFTIKQTNTNCLPFDARLISTTSIPTQPVIVTNWTFGDGTSSVASNDSVNHSYGVLGTYNPSVIIKNAGGCIYAGSNTVSVFGPTGTWTHNTGYICGANPVTFTVNGNSYTDSIIVDFGDGTVSRMLYATNPTFTHSYLTGGDKNPTIILKSLNGCEFPINANGLIQVDYVKASYTSAVTQPQPCGSSTRTFTNTSTMDQSPALATYNWIIKTSTITTKDASLTSFANDTFNVFMQVTSVSGCLDTVTLTQFTTKVNNFPKFQGIGIDRADSACAGQTVKYAVNVDPSQDPITNYIWNFGNGTTISGVNTQSVETFYGTPGLYSDTVTIVTDKGCSATSIKPSLRILTTPTGVSINPGSDQTICQGTTSTTLTGTGATNYYWTPNIALAPKDSSQTVTASPTTFTRYTVHGYNVYGTYSCEDTASINVFVVPKFNATIKANLNDSICLGDSIILSVEGAPAGSSFFWGPSTLIGTFKDSIMVGNPVSIKPIISSPYTVTVVPPSTCQNPQPLTPINIGVGVPINVNLGLDTITLASGSTYQFAPNYGPDEVSVTWSPASEFQNIHDPYPSIIVKANTCYAVQATSIFGCKDTAQLCVRSFCQAAQVFIPNAFTPNGNKQNDYFYVTAYGIEKVISFRVFNRWGQVVFERAGYKPDAYNTQTPNLLTAWDGKFKGTIAPTDVYVYTCEVECANGTRFTYTGNVALIK